MKKFFTSLSIVLYFIAANGQSINSIIEEVNIDSLVSYVRILSGEDSVYIKGSKEIIDQRVYDSNDLAAEYIYEKLASYNLDTYKMEYDTLHFIYR